MKEQAVALLLAEQQLQELPYAIDERQKVVEDPTLIDRRSSAIRDIYAKAIADDEASSYQKALEAVATDSTYLPYQSVRVDVKDWQGVQVEGDHATVQVVMAFTYNGVGQDGKPDQAGAVQWRLDLVREGIRRTRGGG